MSSVPLANPLVDRTIPLSGDARQQSSDHAPHGASVIDFPGSPLSADNAARRNGFRRTRVLLWGAKPIYFAADLAAFVVAAAAFRPGQPGPHAVAFVALVAVFGSYGLYRSRLSLSVLDDLKYLLAGVLTGTLAGLSFAYIFGGLDDEVRFVAEMTAAFGLILVMRSCAQSAVRWARRAGHVRHKSLILGAGHVGLRLASTLQAHREFGLDAVGFLDENPRVDHPDELPVPLLGGFSNLSQQIAEQDIRVVIIAFGTMRENQLVDTIRTCDRLRCEMFFVPRLFEVHTTTRDMDDVWGLPLIRVRRAPFRNFSWRLKRPVDILFSAVALLLTSPLIAACALAVRIETGPGILFRQYRVGLDDKDFCLLKFRSLAPANHAESATMWKVANDERMGPVGRFIRRTSLDELPQLWNVLRGDMSLVGPRPERPHFVSQFRESIPRYSARHRVPSGLTGWAQVHGLRGDTSIEERAIFDNYYIENWSLWGDFKIMVRTVQQLFRRGAH